MNEKKHVSVKALADAICQANGSHNENSARVAILDVLTAVNRCLLAGHSVTLPGLGILSTYTSRPRKGRNPKRPEVTIDIPAKTRVSLTPNLNLLIALNS